MSKLRPNEPLAPRHALPRGSQVDRDSYLLELCRGKNVLHLACAAWPASERWGQEGSLLHVRLGEVTAQLAGFDWSTPGLEVLKRFGATNLHRLDLLDAAEVSAAWARIGFDPDIVLAGELLEHLDRPGSVLANCRSNMRAACRLVITVPNAFSAQGLLHVLLGREKVATDHVSYYSHATLGELVRRNGFTVDAVRWYRYSLRRHLRDHILGSVFAPIFWLCPQLSDGLIAECIPSSGRAYDAAT